jgi:hypothetical protein
MLVGNQLIEQIFCTREIFNAVPSIQASMTKYALEDLNASLHYSDDWKVMGDGDWDDTYDDPKVSAASSTASHRLKQIDNRKIEFHQLSCCLCLKGIM